MRPSSFHSTAAALLLSGLAVFTVPSPASATWSVIAIDQETGQVVIASATCVPQERLRRQVTVGLMELQAVVVPGVGVAAAQANVDDTRQNQMLIGRELRNGTAPEEILRILREDPEFQERQFGILDLRGRSAGFSGSGNSEASLDVQGEIPGEGIFFSIQGNVLASDEVVHAAVRAFRETEGTLTDRVMAAMEAADAMGGDRRCTCETEPLPDAPCDGKTAHVAYILAADPDDPAGERFNDGDYALFIDVTDENIRPNENANPVITLRMRYDAWKATVSMSGNRSG